MKAVKKYKIARRLNVPVFEKCQTQTYATREKQKERRPNRRMPSEFGRQLLEKQKVGYLYGVSDQWIRRCIRESRAVRGHLREDFFVNRLERRLDNIVYRLGLADTRRMSRQMVSHGHITVNGVRTTIPSYRVRDEDEIGIRKGSETASFFVELKEKMDARSRVSWVRWDDAAKKGSILDAPSVDAEFLNFASVFEYYSR